MKTDVASEWARTKLRAARRWERFGREVTAATGWQVWNPGIYGEPWHARFRAAYPLLERPLVVFGLNPGPYGMAQTGIPFTDVKRLRDQLPRLAGDLASATRGAPVAIPGLAPTSLHPYLTRTFESSAVRVYLFLAQGWGSAEEGFRRVVVANPCTLLFMDPETRENKTPADLLRVARARGTHDARALRAEMDRLRWLAAREAIEALAPRGVILLGANVADAMRQELATGYPSLCAIEWEHPARAVPKKWARGLLAMLAKRAILPP